MYTFRVEVNQKQVISKYQRQEATDSTGNQEGRLGFKYSFSSNSILLPILGFFFFFFETVMMSQVRVKISEVLSNRFY